jgi:hypothetical protein
VALLGGVTGAERTEARVRRPITMGRSTAKDKSHGQGTITIEESTTPKGPAEI